MNLKNREITPFSPDSNNERTEQIDLDAKQKERLDRYKNVKGNQSFFKKVWAMFYRRFLVFYREPRQWALIVAPMINILNIVMMTHGVEKLEIAMIPLDSTIDEGEKRHRASANYFEPH